MRLRDLDATFVGAWHPGGYTRLRSAEGAQGLLFQCPKCSEGKERGEGHVKGAHYVLCWFANPRNAPRVPDDAKPGPGRWIFAGDSIDDVNFVGPAAASVHVTGEGCGWHGFVRNGAAA